MRMLWDGHRFHNKFPAEKREKLARTVSKRDRINAWKCVAMYCTRFGNNFSNDQFASQMQSARLSVATDNVVAGPSICSSLSMKRTRSSLAAVKHVTKAELVGFRVRGAVANIPSFASGADYTDCIKRSA